MVIGYVEVKDRSGEWQALWSPEDDTCPVCSSGPLGCLVCNSGHFSPRYHYLCRKEGSVDIVDFLVGEGRIMWGGGEPSFAEDWKYENAAGSDLKALLARIYKNCVAVANTAQLLVYDWKRELQIELLSHYDYVRHWRESKQELLPNPSFFSGSDLEYFRSRKLLLSPKEFEDYYGKKGRMYTKEKKRLSECYVHFKNYRFCPGEMYSDFVNEALPRIVELAPPERSRVIFVSL